MITIFRVLTVAILSAAFSVPCALAAEIAIDSEEYAQLPADAQSKLLAEMKGKGLVSEGDTVKNSATPSASKTLGPAALLPFVPIVCKTIADAKKQDELGKCAAAKDTAEKCKAGVESKFGTIQALCDAVKIF